MRNLLAHEVEPAHLLGDGVLDLEARVDLEEADRAVPAHEELAGAGADVARLPEDRLRAGVEPLELVVGEERRRGLLEELLVTALQRAVAGGGHHDGAVAVGQALGLDVPGPVEVALHEALAAAEGGDRLAGGRVVHRRDLLERAGDLEAAAAAAVRGLDRHGQAVLAGELDDLVRPAHRVGRAGHLRGADVLGDVTGRDLVAEHLDGLRRRADPQQPGGDDGPGEVGVLGQEAVTGVDGVGAAALGDRHDLVDVQIGLGGGRAVQREGLVGQLDEQGLRVGVGVDGDRADPGVLRRADDADRDLTAVGDEDLRDGACAVVVSHVSS